MRVTIKDIARETGVSTSTVSIVLNHKPHRLSEDTRKKVLDAAKRMNYRPNSMAASLKTRKTKTIGIVLSDFANAYYAELAKGAEERCAQAGYGMILCSSNSGDADNINSLIDRGVDGIILALSGITPEKRKELVNLALSFGIPVVSTEYNMHMDEVSSICLDNYKGGYLATAHLLELGHTKVGWIIGSAQEGDAQDGTNQRFFGYKKALEEYGIPFCMDYVINGSYKIQSGEECAPKLIEKGVTGVVAANDLCAYGIYKWARENHLRIPEDLSVVGYDDIAYSDFFSPRLTTVRQPAYKIGFEAAGKMIEQQEETVSAERKDIVFQPELIVRESTCRCKEKR